MPAGRDETRDEVREWREDEEPVTHRRVRHLEESRRGGRIGGRGERRCLRRAVDRQSGAPEHEQVEVELTRSPATACAPAELAFESLQLDEQACGPGGRIGTGGDIEGNHGVEEVGLVDHADGLGSIEPGDVTEARAGQGVEGSNGIGQRPLRVADIRPEPDVRPDSMRHTHLDRPRSAPGYSRRVQRVAVRILHPEPVDGAGELTRLVASARAIVAAELAPRFTAAGAHDVRIIAGPPDGRSFGERLRGLASELGPRHGLIVLGSGSIPLATDAHLTSLVVVAGSGQARALTNNRYSSDVVAIGDAAILAGLPDLASDNALPRWLEQEGGATVDELPERARLGLDIDSPLDLELLRRDGGCPPALAKLAKSMGHRLERAAEVFDKLAALARDSRRELLVAGRLSATALLELEERSACRVRALIEERGLRTSVAGQRPPASALGMLLDREGAAEIGVLVARLADGAVIDTRVLLAHRLGPDEAAWPSPEDRFASDLLLADRILDPWLQQLTLHAWSHAVPIALGGHTLIAPGLRLALGLAG